MVGRHGWLVAVAVLLAGCGGALGTGTETATPSPAAPHVAAPGVTATGVVDTDRLTRAHVSSLQNQSYTVRSVIRLSRDNGTDQTHFVKLLRVGQDHRHERFSQYRFGVSPGAEDAQPQMETWSTENESFSAVDAGSRLRYTHYKRPIDPPLLDGEEAIQIYFGSIEDVEVRKIDYGGWIAYRIEGVDPGQPSPEKDLRVDAVIDSFGLLHEFHLAGPAERFFWFSRPFWLRWDRISVTFQYTSIGATTVEQPAWVAAEWNQSRIA